MFQMLVSKALEGDFNRFRVHAGQRREGPALPPRRFAESMMLPSIMGEAARQTLRHGGRRWASGGTGAVPSLIKARRSWDGLNMLGHAQGESAAVREPRRRARLRVRDRAEAGRAILPHFRAALDVENKAALGGYDPVTIAPRRRDRRPRPPAQALSRARAGRRGAPGARRAASRGTGSSIPSTGRKLRARPAHWGVLITLDDDRPAHARVAYQPFVGEAFRPRARGHAQWRRGHDDGHCAAPLPLARGGHRRHH